MLSHVTDALSVHNQDSKILISDRPCS